MFKPLLSLGLLLTLTSCGSANTPTVPTTSPDPNTQYRTPYPEDVWQYTNTDYHFSLTLPKVTYSLTCTDQSRPVQTVEMPDKVEVGNRFDCAETDPRILQGWTLFAAKDINNQKDADVFIKKVLGSGCKVNEWSTEGFSIDHISISMAKPGLSDGDIETSMNECGFPWQGKYRGFYSAKWKTLVFWSLTQEPQFVKKDTKEQYDEEILQSFKFLE